MLHRVVVWLGCAACCFFPAASAGQLPPSSNAASSRGASPALQIEEPVWNFGQAVAGQKLRHEFAFVNVGDRPLTIRRVQSDCGCTTAEKSGRVIGAGEKGSIAVALDTQSLRGNVRKRVSVDCDDPVFPIVQLQISGTVVRAVDAEPASVNFGSLSGGEAGRAAVRLVNHLQQDVVLRDARSTDVSVDAKLTAVEPGRVYELSVTAAPAGRQGRFEGEVRIATDFEKVPYISVPYYGDRLASVAATPAEIMLPYRVARPMAMRILIRQARGERLKILDLRASDPKLQAEIVEDRGDSGIYFLMVSIPTGYAPPDGAAEIQLATDDKETPALNIPIRQPPPPAIEVLPASVVLSLSPAGRAQEGASLRIINHTSRDMRLESVETDRPEIQAELTPVKPGKEYRLLVSIGAEVSGRSLRGRITLKTDLPDQPPISVAVIAYRRQKEM